MSLVLLAFSIIGIHLPVAEVYPLQEDYTNIFGPVWRFAVRLDGGLPAGTNGGRPAVPFLETSHQRQAPVAAQQRVDHDLAIIDTFTVNTIFLYNNPTVFTGDFGDLMDIILSVYVLKVAIAALDTPLCYLGVWVMKKVTGVNPEEVA